MYQKVVLSFVFYFLFKIFSYLGKEFLVLDDFVNGISLIIVSLIFLSISIYFFIPYLFFLYSYSKEKTPEEKEFEKIINNLLANKNFSYLDRLKIHNCEKIYFSNIRYMLKDKECKNKIYELSKKYKINNKT